MKNQNKKQSVNVLDLAMEVTKSNMKTSRRSGKSNNDFMLEILLDKKMTRNEIVSNIFAKRFEAQILEIHSNLKKDEVLAENEEIAKYYKTVKNAVDTSISKSNNNSSFHYNEAYKAFELKRLENGSYTILKR